MMDRRLFLAGVAALSACADNRPQPRYRNHEKRMAITMDDFNLGFDIGLSQEARHENILEAFEAVNHKAAGFVTGSFIDSRLGHRILRDWIRGGHIIANHTWTHPHANETDTTAYLSNIEKKSWVLTDLSRHIRLFPFPFLR